MATAAAAGSASASTSTSDHLKLRIAEITECAICCNDCSIPKALPCLHSFCSRCLRELWKDKRPGDRCMCPVCRKGLTLPQYGVDELPHSFIVSSLIDARDASSARPCEACQKNGDDSEGGVSPAATAYCVTCNEKLCQQCSLRHTMRNGGPPHRVEELKNGKPGGGKYCTQHQGKLLELFCIDCKANICLKCFAVEHSRHQCREVEFAAEEIVKSSGEHVQQVYAQIGKLHDQLAQLEAEEDKLLTAVQKVEMSMKLKSEAVKLTVDTQLDGLLKQVHSFKTTSRKRIRALKDGLKQRVKAMQSFASNSQEMAMMTEDARDVTGAAADMHARAEALLNYSHAAVPSDYSAPGVKFVPTNIDELSGEQNFVGRVLTTNDPEFNGSTTKLSVQTVRERELDCSNAQMKTELEHRERSMLQLEKQLLLETEKRFYRQQQTKQKYKHSAMKVLKTVRGSGLIAAVTLDDKLYALRVAEEVDQIVVFSAAAGYAVLRQLTVPGLTTDRDSDVTSCVPLKCLFISDACNNCLYRCIVGDDDQPATTTAFPTIDKPVALSVTPRNSLLVTLAINRVQEFGCDDFKLIRQVEPLQSDIKNSLTDAAGLQLASHLYAVSNANRVCVVDSDGRVTLSYDRQPSLVDVGCHVTADADNFIFVADGTNRIAVLCPDLQLVRHVKLNKDELARRLHLDQASGRLYVTLLRGDVIVIQV